MGSLPGGSSAVCAATGFAYPALIFTNVLATRAAEPPPFFRVNDMGSEGETESSERWGAGRER